MAIPITQLTFAFLEGVGLIASPCILPILPIMLAASLDGGRKRPLGIITGFILAFSAFALLSRQLLTWLHADPDVVRNSALVLLVFFGLVMLSKNLSDKLLSATQGLANFGQGVTERFGQGNGYWSGVALGSLIGLIWTPCAGPIMAAAVVQIIQAKTSIEATFTVVAFALGAGIPMLIIALMGRQIMTRLSFLKTHSYTVRRILGVVIIAAAALIYRGVDQGTVHEVSSTSVIEGSGQLLKGLSSPRPAPEFTGLRDWLNSPPLKMVDLKGKVVLVDFWTYSCINCVRTLPTLTGWDTLYREKGLVIVGVHAPEFEFEKKKSNVEMALQKYGIHYPVALDNDLETWNVFQNHFWPTQYLINKEGNIVYVHEGEGGEAITENNIRFLLGLDVPKKTENPTPLAFSAQHTPETYLGLERAVGFENKKGGAPKVYRFPETLALNHWALDGAWVRENDKIKSMRPGASLRFHFKARKVFLVLGSSQPNASHVTLRLNGNALIERAGSDVKNGKLTVDHEALYELIDQGSVKEGTLELTVEDQGLSAYAFTFGS